MRTLIPVDLSLGSGRRLVGHLILRALPLFLLVAVVIPASAYSQADVTPWSKPIPLLDPATHLESLSPRITIDPAGKAHAVFQAWTGEGKPDRWAANTIFYTTLDESGWSIPIDIVVAPASTILIDVSDIASTSDGYLVLAYTVAGDVTVASAPIAGAADARSWSTSLIDRGIRPRIAIDLESLRWYVGYDVDNSMIRLAHSSDGGVTWSMPDTIATTNEPGTALSFGSIFLTADDSVHLTWTENSVTRSWQGVAIWHAYMSPGGDALANVRQVARSSAPGDPTLDGSMMCGGQNGMLHLFWNNGVGSATGRFHQWSADNGVTWSKTEAIFPGLSGQTERAGCATDSAGYLHYITAANGFGFSHAIIRHAVWRDGRWSNFENLWSSDYPGERPNLAISAGNTLHLFWDHFGEQATQVVYTSRVVDAPFITPPGFDEPAWLKPEPVPTMPPITPVSPEEPEPEITELPKIDADIPGRTTGLMEPIALGVLATMLMVGSILALFVRRRK